MTSTLKFIEKIRQEVQRYSKELIKLFPNRINRFSEKDLSKFWGKSVEFIQKQRYYKKKDSNYQISENALEELKNAVINKFDQSKTKKIIDIIHCYHNKEIDFYQFFLFLKQIIQKIVIIKLTDLELSIIFGYNSNTLNKVKNRIIDVKNKKYNPEYKFSLERLEILRNNIKNILKKKSRKANELINNYINSNKDIKDYVYQQYTIKYPKYFHNMKTQNQFY